jgi:hypothetical protein
MFRKRRSEVRERAQNLAGTGETCEHSGELLDGLHWLIGGRFVMEIITKRGLFAHPAVAAASLKGLGACPTLGSVARDSGAEANFSRDRGEQSALFDEIAGEIGPASAVPQ